MFFFTFIDFIVRVYRESFNMYHLLTFDSTLGIAVLNGECFNCLIQIMIQMTKLSQNMLNFCRKVIARFDQDPSIIFNVFQEMEKCSSPSRVWIYLTKQLQKAT